jgi:hypothetical protein
MKPAAVLLSVVWLSACSFPDFEVTPAPIIIGQATCDDGARNGDETGIDCGMAACNKACAAGQGCSRDADCDGGACEDQVCRAQNCEDGLQNADESDTDCGGALGCARCLVGQRCGSASDCDGGACASGQCRAPTCKDQLLNANETDLDCGGDSCLPCAVGQACTQTEDCDAVACSEQKCQPAGCDDAVWNQDETDLDCGGSCPAACADALRCKVAGDCQSGVCSKQTLRCAAPRCDDGVLNGDEPSEDCGGDCSKKCVTLDACSSAADCETNACSSKTCVPANATGSAIAPIGWIATASDSFDLSDTQAIIDGNAGTDWTSGSNRYAGMWIQIDMQQREAFFRLEIDTEKALDAATAVNIWTSNDGTFTTAVKQNVPGGTQIVIDFASAQVARYLKIELAQGGTDWWRVNEIRVMQ